MDVHDALYKAAHEHPGGIEALAVRMGKGAQVLRNKLNTNTATNVVSLAEFDMMLPMVGYDPLRALAAQHGFALYQVADGDGGDQAVLEMFAALVGSHGNVGTEIYAALADGRIEAHEMKRINAAARKMHSDLQSLVARLAGMAEKS